MALLAFAGVCAAIVRGRTRSWPDACAAAGIALALAFVAIVAVQALLDVRIDPTFGYLIDGR
jgi:hypothetical protein